MIKFNETLYGCVVTLCAASCFIGCDKQDREPPPPTTVELPVNDNETLSAKSRKIAETAIEQEVDLIGDKPEAVAAAPKKETLLKELKPQEPINHIARKAYKIMDEIRINLESIRKDLDDNGKEITRLIRVSDLLAKNITNLKDIWATDETFCDICGSAKGRVLLLNDELSRAPRKWTHIRWAFNSVVQELRRLRAAVTKLAEAEPKPIAVVGKDGRVSYVEPPPAPIDPRIAAKERKLREVENAKAKLKRYEEAKKNKPLQTELDEK